MASDWKERLGVVFSTNPDFKYETSTNEETTTLEPSKQNLKIWLDRLKGGRVATVIRGYVGSSSDLAELGKNLKKSCALSKAYDKFYKAHTAITGDGKKKIGNT